MNLFNPFNITDNGAITLIGAGVMLLSRGLDELYGKRDKHDMLFVGGTLIVLYSVFK